MDFGKGDDYDPFGVKRDVPLNWLVYSQVASFHCYIDIFGMSNSS